MCRRPKRLRRRNDSRSRNGPTRVSRTRSDPIGISVLRVVGVGIRLEASIDDNRRCMGFHEVVLLIPRDTVRRLLAKLGTDIPVQRLSSWMDEFGVIFVEDFLGDQG